MGGSPSGDFDDDSDGHSFHGGRGGDDTDDDNDEGGDGHGGHRVSSDVVEIFDSEDSGSEFVLESSDFEVLSDDEHKDLEDLFCAVYAAPTTTTTFPSLSSSISDPSAATTVLTRSHVTAPSVSPPPLIVTPLLPASAPSSTTFTSTPFNVSVSSPSAAPSETSRRRKLLLKRTATSPPPPGTLYGFFESISREEAEARRVATKEEREQQTRDIREMAQRQEALRKLGKVERTRAQNRERQRRRRERKRNAEVCCFVFLIASLSPDQFSPFIFILELRRQRQWHSHCFIPRHSRHHTLQPGARLIHRDVDDYTHHSRHPSFFVLSRGPPSS